MRTNRPLIGFVAWLAVYALFCILLYALCRYNLAILADFGTMYYNGQFVTDTLFSIGALSVLISQWLVQWMVSPTAAVCITAALLTVMSMANARIIRHFSRSYMFWPLSLVPGIWMCAMMCHPSCDYNNAVGLTLMSLCVCVVICERDALTRMIDAVLLTVVLSVGAQGVALCFAVLTLMVQMRDNWRTCWLMLVPVAIAIAFYIGEQYTGVNKLIVNDIPLSVIIISLIAWLLSGLTHAGKSLTVACLVVLTAAVAIFSVTVIRRNYNPDDNAANELSYYIGQGDYDSVTARYKAMPQYDATLQNCMNLALAEKHMLAQRLFYHTNQGTQSLYNMTQPSPHNYMLLSDVFYSMGLIALAQRYAFESNQGMGNYSPRMLRRLVDTNIIYGSYPVAQKYINLLKSTHRYHEWATERESLLYDDSAVKSHPELGPKRACIIADNRFAGDRGIADDLLQVLRTNPSHDITMQYLGAVFMLQRNVPSLMTLIDEFAGTETLHLPLPEHFQEAVVVGAIASNQPLDTRYQIHPSVMQRCKEFWAEHKPQPNTFWHYLRTKQAEEAQPASATTLQH